MDGSPRDENGQSFPRTTTGMEPDSTRLDSTLQSTCIDSIHSFSLPPPPLFSANLPSCPFLSAPLRPSRRPNSTPLQFDSHKLAAIHLALVLKRESRPVGRREIKSTSLSLAHILAVRCSASPSLFQPDSGAHIRLEVKDGTYLAAKRVVPIHAVKERGLGEQF